MKFRPVRRNSNRASTEDVMRNFPTRRFIQSTILFALAVLAVIIGAFALSNQGGNNNADTERDRANAGAIIKRGSYLQDAFNRAVADGVNPLSIRLSSSETAPLIGLFDPTYRYGVNPTTPSRAFPSGTSVNFALTTADVSGVGTGAGDDISVTLTGVSDSVCQRINRALAGTNALLAVPTSQSGQEGCYSDGTDNIYWRVVSSDQG